MGSIRQIKISRQVRRELSELLHDDLAEKYGIITITEVYINPDFRNAKIYISMLNEKYYEIVLNILNKNAKKYQHILGKKLKIKFTPTLLFFIENSQGNIDKIDKLISEIDNGT